MKLHLACLFPELTALRKSNKICKLSPTTIDHMTKVKIGYQVEKYQKGKGALLVSIHNMLQVPKKRGQKRGLGAELTGT